MAETKRKTTRKKPTAGKARKKPDAATSKPVAPKQPEAARQIETTDIASEGPLKAEGFLFIGDPHVSSRKPGRRKDRDFAATVLGKLEAAINITNERRLVPVILGDLFDRPKEDDEDIKTKLIRILRRAWTKSVVLVGNHDRRHAVLTDGDSLAVLAEADVIAVVTKSGPIAEFLIGQDEVRFALGGTPHGQDIPNDVRALFPEADTVVWITHHDIAFDSAYPGSMDAFEILGCPLVINGHMHLTKRELTRGRTTWFNPGNITRQAIDAIDHVPRVCELKADGTIEQHDLPYERNVFDLTGKLVTAVSPGEVPPEDDEESLFVNLLQAEAATEMERTDDGSLLREEIEAKFQREGTPTDVRSAIMTLFTAVTNPGMNEDEEKVA